MDASGVTALKSKSNLNSLVIKRESYRITLLNDTLINTSKPLCKLCNFKERPSIILRKYLQEKARLRSEYLQ